MENLTEYKNIKADNTAIQRILQHCEKIKQDTIAIQDRCNKSIIDMQSELNAIKRNK